MSTSRRNFLGLGALALSGAAGGTAFGAPARRKPSDLLKVGLILGEWAHSTGWGPMMNGIDGDRNKP